MNRVHRWICSSGHWKTVLEEDVLPKALDGFEFGDNVLEVGPGFGFTTEWLRRRFKQVTALELDPDLAHLVRNAVRGTSVRVVQGDGTALPFKDKSFSGAVAFTMLHHVPSTRLQDRLFAEVCRVIKPGGIFAGVDSVGGLRMRLLHIADVLVPIEPANLAPRLEAAGFTGVSIKIDGQRFRFGAARRPEAV
jgi:SAM-dependent methyltransferase